MQRVLSIFITAFILVACGEVTERAVPDNYQDGLQDGFQEEVQSADQSPSQGLVRATTRSDDEFLLLLAETFIDTFYSFDAARLEALLSNAPDSLLPITYYQGWAEGGNYQILQRRPCELITANTISCAITVEDDAMLALDSDFKVTDTFTLTFTAGNVVSVETSSDDLPIYYEAGDWVRENIPELIEEPCRGFFAGGPTPGDCARAMAEGYARFAASEEFPGF